MYARSMDHIYRDLLTQVHADGLYEINTRTGVGIRVLPGGYSFKLDLSDGKLPVPGNRRYWPRLAAAETAWQFMGTQSPEWIVAKAPKMWSNFVEDDKLKTAYGYRWRKHFGRDQLAMAINELWCNPTNRQLYISAWDPATDGLGAPNQPKNIPCPVGFSVSRLKNLIHMSVFIRSSDVFVGLPYDVMSYALTLDAISREIECLPGTLHVTLAHPHLYSVHLGAVEQCLNVGEYETWTIGEHAIWTANVQPDLPRWTVLGIGNNPDLYVTHMTRLSMQVEHNDWNPHPELIV